MPERRLTIVAQQILAKKGIKTIERNASNAAKSSSANYIRKAICFSAALDAIWKNNHDFLLTVWIAGARQYSSFLQFTIHQNFVV